MAYKSQDYKYLVVGYDGYKDTLTPQGAEQRWKDIFDEWVKLSDNNTLIYYYQLISEVTYLETRFTVSKILLYQVYTQDMNEKTLDMYIEALGLWKYHYNKDADKLLEIKRLLAQHRASANNLGNKKSELENMQMENTEDAQTLEAQAVILEQITGKNNIDVHTTSVLKWIEIGKLANSINEQRRKNGK